MATDPSIIIKQAVQFFLSQWYLGLRPSLVVNTGYYGDIFLSSEVKTCQQPYQPSSFRRRRSGQQSRQRRSDKRTRARALLANVSNKIDGLEASTPAKPGDVERDPEPLNSLEKLNEDSCEPIIGMYQISDLDDASIIDLDNASVESALMAVNVNAAVQAVPQFTDVSCQSDPNKPQFNPRSLSIVRNKAVSIPPKKIFHPAIINASKSRYGKHPSELSQEEIVQFNTYLKWKHDIGEPVQDDLIYLPSMIRDCLHCGYPT